MIHIIAIPFLRLSQANFPGAVGWGLECHRHTAVPAGSRPGEPPATCRGSLGPEWHCFHMVRVFTRSRVCLPADFLKTASLPIAETILCIFFFTGSESFLKVSGHSSFLSVNRDKSCSCINW